MEQRTRSQQFGDRWSQLQSERKRVVESKWKDIAEYFCPERGRFESNESEPDTSQALRGSKILDSTGQYAMGICVNGMYSQLSSPVSKWFRLAFEDDALNDNQAAKAWIARKEDKVYTYFRRSNWYSSIRSTDAELLAFGMACLFQGESSDPPVYYRNFTAGEYWAGQNSQGVVDTLYRRSMMTAAQMVQRFGENRVSRKVRESSTKAPATPYEVLHAVQPRKQYDPLKLDKINMPWESCYLEVGNDYSLLAESGFKRFPYIVPRYLTISNDVYACGSPGWSSLPDNKMLQDMEESKVRLIHKLVEPPMIAPTSLKGRPLRSGAGGITYADGPGATENLKPLYQVQGRINELQEEMAEVRQRILRAWYYDIFLMLQQVGAQGVTATQILEMAEEKKLQLGPLVSVHTDDILEPAVDYLVQIVIEEDLLTDPPPQEIMGAGYKVEFISQLAQAQRQQEARSIDQTIAFTGSAATMYPEVLDCLDIDEAWRRRAELTGLPIELVRGTDLIEQIRAQRAEQQAQLEQAQQAMAMVQGAQQLSQTSTDPAQPNALTDIAKMVGQQAGVPG